MEDLIRKSDAIKIANELVKVILTDNTPLSVKTGSDYLYVNVVCPIRNIPAVEPKQGEWVKVTNGRGGHECSECHGYAPSYQSGDEHLSDYCPRCGARMKGADDGK